MALGLMGAWEQEDPEHREAFNSRVRKVIIAIPLPLSGSILQPAQMTEVSLQVYREHIAGTPAGLDWKLFLMSA